VALANGISCLALSAREAAPRGRTISAIRHKSHTSLTILSHVGAGPSRQEAGPRLVAHYSIGLKAGTPCTVTYEEHQPDIATACLGAFISASVKQTLRHPSSSAALAGYTILPVCHGHYTRLNCKDVAPAYDLAAFIANVHTHLCSHHLPSLDTPDPSLGFLVPMYPLTEASGPQSGVGHCFASHLR
jgi:hypothetical protein